MPDRTPGPARLLAFALLTTAAGLLGLEGAARVLEGPDAARTAEAWSPLASQVLPSPFLRPYDGGFTFHERLIDHPEQAIPAERPPGELRVVFVGGSGIAGAGLPRLAGPVSVAARALQAANPDRPVRVWNLGRSGYASPQVAELLDGVIDAIQPDLVVAALGNNERMDIANVLFQQPRPRAILGARLARGHSALARLVRPPKARGPVDPNAAAPDMPNESQVPERDLQDRYVVSRLRRSLRRIRASAERVGAQLLVSTVPINPRYNPYGHEWYFLDREVLHRPPVRLGHWATYYGGWEHVVPAIRQDVEGRLPHIVEDLLLVQGRDALGKDLEDATARVRSWSAAHELATTSAEDAILIAWGRRLLDGPEAAREAILPWVRQHGLTPRSRGETCAGADVLFAAGAREEAKEAYDACFLSAHYFRADERLRAVLRGTASDGPLVDVHAELQARSPGGTPDYTWFLDYCHYNSRGATFAGHLLAAGMQATLGLPDTVLDADEALARHDELRQGRPSDLPRVDRWAGADFDPAVLTGARPGVGTPPPRQNAHFSEAMVAIYRGNAAAQTASEANPEAAAQAAKNWRQARVLDPDLEAASFNLEWLDARGLLPP